jgi:hypothetical protein
MTVVDPKEQLDRRYEDAKPVDIDHPGRRR